MFRLLLFWCDEDAGCVNSTKFPNSGWLYAGMFLLDIFSSLGGVGSKSCGAVSFFLAAFGEIKSSAKIMTPSVENKITRKIFSPELMFVGRLASDKFSSFGVNVVDNVSSASGKAGDAGRSSREVIMVRSL